MRVITSIAVLIIAVPMFALAADPALAADTAAAAPPAPPAVTYEVWGFKLTGGQWAQQPNYNFTTTDLKQAADYKARINSFAGWTVTSNLPDASYVHTVYDDPMVSRVRPTQTPQSPMYSVWAYKLADGKWVKDDKQSWSTPDPVARLADVSKDAVRAVTAGWTAVSRPTAPSWFPEGLQGHVNGGTVQGAQNYAMRINLGGYSFSVPYSAIQNAGQRQATTPARRSTITSPTTTTRASKIRSPHKI